MVVVESEDAPDEEGWVTVICTHSSARETCNCKVNCMLDIFRSSQKARILTVSEILELVHLVTKPEFSPVLLDLPSVPIDELHVPWLDQSIFATELPVE